MKIEEVKSKTDTELGFDLSSMKRELFDLRFKARTAGTANPARLRVLRRSIARVETVLKERSRKPAKQAAK